MKKIMWALALALAFTMSANAANNEKTPTSNENCPFVTVRDGKFYIGNKEYSYVGANMWYAGILGCKDPNKGGNRERLIKELDLMKKYGVDNVRVLIGAEGRDNQKYHISPILQPQPGEYDADLLEGLDFMMAEFEKRDMKAILFFTNSWEWSGGYGSYLEWVNGVECPLPADGYNEYTEFVKEFVVNEKCKELYYDYVRYIVTRTNTITGKPYKESPALMAWEVANEPRCFSRDPKYKAALVDWIDKTSRLVKSLDPNHLMTTGSEGEEGCEYDLELFTKIHTLPCIDYACIHIWPKNWRWTKEPTPTGQTVKDYVEQMTREYVERAYKALSPYKKPIVLEEFGYARDNDAYAVGTPTKAKDEYYQFMFELTKNSGMLNGCNFWGWAGLAEVKHEWWQKWDDYTSDPAQEPQGLYCVYAKDKSTMKLIKKYAR